MAAGAQSGRRESPRGKSGTAAPKAGRARRPRQTGPAPHETSRDPRQEFNDDEWHDMVATAAYYLAESRGFEGGSPDEDWYEAEAQLREQMALAEDEADAGAEGDLVMPARGRNITKSK